MKEKLTNRENSERLVCFYYKQFNTLSQYLRITLVMNSCKPSFVLVNFNTNCRLRSIGATLFLQT